MGIYGKFFFVLLAHKLLISMSNGKPSPPGPENEIDWNTFQNPELGEHIEGDILLSDVFSGKTGLKGERYRWPNNTLVYEIGAGFTPEEEQYIANGIEELQAKTCIKFVQRTNEKDYVAVLTTSSGCYSNVGFQGGRQTVNLEPRCFHVGKGTAVHEIMHSLGVNHEHTRPDRDDYVQIHMERIEKSTLGNFEKETKDSVDDFGVEYDYGSIMHYPKNAFHSDPNNPETITVKTEGAIIGQRKAMSPKDVQKLRNMYKCD